MSQENIQGRTLARTHALYYAATGQRCSRAGGEDDRLGPPRIVTGRDRQASPDCRDESADRLHEPAFDLWPCDALEAVDVEQGPDRTIEAVYVAKRRISPVYLLDALAQAVRIVAWIHSRRRTRNLEAAGLRE